MAGWLNGTFAHPPMLKVIYRRNMFDIGFSELMLVGVLGLIILGPERLPKAARTVGLMVGKVRRTMSGIQQEIEQEVRNQEIREKLKDPLQTFKEDDPEYQRYHDDNDDAPSESETQQAETADSQLHPEAIQSQIDAMHAHHPKDDASQSAATPDSELKNSAQQDK